MNSGLPAKGPATQGPTTKAQLQLQLQLQTGNTNQLIPKLLPLPLHDQNSHELDM